MSTTPWHEEPSVFVIDCDSIFCQTLRKVVRGLAVRAEFFDSGEEFLQAVDSARRGCLIVDPSMAQWPLAAWFAKLAARGIHLPMIVASQRGDVPLVVESMQAGALNYIQKPCDEELLADALRGALAWDATHGNDMVEAARVRRRLNRLSPGERQVLEMLVDGKTNQQVAAALGRSVRAIEVRRAKIREKMRTRSLADLVRFSVAGLASGSDR